MAGISNIYAADAGKSPAVFCLPDSYSLPLQSPGGDAYRIDLVIPAGTAPEAGWPAVYLLDASGCFATCVEAMRRMSRRPDATGVSPCVIVGISSASGYDTQRRQRDYDPDQGAQAFLRFLTDDVKALVARHAPLDARRDTLFGHSLAGYFTLWALACNPPGFGRYAAISPSVWSGKEGLLAGIAALRPQGQQAMICIGEWEDQLPPWQAAAPGSEAVRARRAQRDMLGNAREMATLLASVLGAGQVRYHYLPDEDHASILSAAIPRMLRMASAQA